MKKPKKLKPGRNEEGKFIEGNKAAEKWTEKTVLTKLQEIWATLVKDEDDEVNKNVVRSNDIKTLAEVCLMNGISKQRWSEWKEKFGEKKVENAVNEDYSESVSELIKNIEWVIETRLVYSGGTMDIFVLKNHYGYKDNRELDLGNKDDKPFKTKTIDYSKIPDDVLDTLIAATSQDDE
jgi:hypothetical protein